LQAAGGALIGGLGGGSVFTAVGGGLGAGLSSKLAGQLDSLSKGIASETGSALLGNLAANVAAGVGGVLVGGTSGAATASSVELYNQMNHKNSLVPSSCTATGPCNEAVMTAQMNATGANAQAALQNMQAEAPYIAGTLALGFAAGPDAIIAAATLGGVDYANDLSAYVTKLSTDAPNIAKSYATGLIGGAFGPLSIADTEIVGLSKGGIVAAGGYNAIVNGTSAFGAAAATNGNPDLSSGVAAGTTAAGYTAQALIPGPAGVFVNKVIQNSAGVIQSVIQK
jgi:filamentous hemagglutinin